MLCQSITVDHLLLQFPGSGKNDGDRDVRETWRSESGVVGLGWVGCVMGG